MLLEHAGFIFGVPSDSILELLNPQPERFKQVEQSQQLIWQDRPIPIIDLARHWVFNQIQRGSEMQGGPVVNRPTVLVVGDDQSLGGFKIERFWGEQEVTVRKIASPLPLAHGFSRSTVLGDGRVVPIIDPVMVLQWCLEREQKGVVPVKKSPPTRTAPSTRSILVVDDSVNVRRFLVETLEKAGYQVEQAKDGQEAVDKLAAGLSVQAVVCDIEMPRLDGYGVLEEVKGQARFADLPILMLTSRSHDKHRKVAMNLGASAYFSKPFNEQDLLDNLDHLTAGMVLAS